MDQNSLFLIVDGNALLHRAWHAIPPLTTSDGRVVNAAYGFAMVVEKMLEQYNPSHMAVAWDLPGGTFRHEAYEEYKGTREKKEDELYEQIDLIQDILDVYGIPSLSAEGFEADDVLGTLAKKYGKADRPVRIVTGDLDSLQLVNEHVHVVFFVKGLSQTKEYDIEAVHERYGLSPKQLIDFKALMGDPSDNIPGIAGIGKKSATELLQAHQSISGIFKALKAGEVPSKFAKKLEGQKDVAKEMQFLVTIVQDVDLEGFRITDAKVMEPEVEALKELFTELEFKTLLRKYNGASAEAKPVQKKQKNSNVEIVELSELKSERIALWLDRHQADLFDQSAGTVMVTDGKQVAKVPLSDTSAVKALQELMMSAEDVVGHRVKQVLHAIDFPLDARPTIFDVAIAGYALSPGAREFDLPDLVHTYLSYMIDLTDAGAALNALFPLADVLKDEIEQEALGQIVYDIEMPLVSVLYAMERRGIAVDEPYLQKMSEDFAKELDALTAQIHTLAGREFNINSPSQLAQVFFDELMLPTKKIKKTKTGYSTAASELEKLWDEHEIVPLISQYREFAKLKSTYIDALPKLIANDGRIHTTFNQTVAATGRLSSSDPNLQNIPIRTQHGRKIRDAFVAPKGKVLLAIDYSQFELRIASVMANDDVFLNAFKNGEDIHTATAAQILDKTPEAVTKEERYAAKAINFGILYGMGTRNLAKSSGLSKEEAKAFLQKYFDLHPGIANYIEETKKKAHKDEYVETLFGRKRYLPEINAGVQMLVAAAERMAVNMPIQGTQADLIKMAMLKVDDWLREQTADVEMLLQVHDELVFEVKKEDLPLVQEELRKLMESIWEADVPLVVDCESGTRWGSVE